ncbi:MAG: hypothetical protein A2030_11580 [Chloroflexi bacterium RBG_19FT_COMBO_50_10]|nr:MAG: hypothetical protein A2030_11580 [Chloroflexi bacterium RBG_19FT_COMBO_50_10]
MQTRKLGKSGIDVSALGLGYWAIGGPFWHLEQKPESIVGYSDVDDDESIRAVWRALDLGVNFFDTSDVYGCEQSERILGRALTGQRQRVVIVTKFGFVPDEKRHFILDEDSGRSSSARHVKPAYGG